LTAVKARGSDKINLKPPPLSRAGGFVKLYSIQIFVENLEKARLFYSRALKLREIRDDSNSDSMIYGIGSGMRMIVTAASPYGPEAALVGRFSGITLAVADLDALYRTMNSDGVPFEMAPRTLQSGVTVASVRDPSHNIITLLQRKK